MRTSFSAFALGLAISVGATSAVSADVQVAAEKIDGMMAKGAAALRLVINEHAPGYPVISEGGVTYDLATGTVEFDLFGEVFCFGFASPTSPGVVGLSARNANEHVVIDNLRLSSALQYRLAPNEMAISPANRAQCFYSLSGDLEDFGLFGVPPQVAPAGSGNDPVRVDRFEGQPVLSVSFLGDGLPQWVNPNSFVNYTLRVANTGTGDLDRVGFQELFPRNPDFYDAFLTTGSFLCQPSNGAECADAAPSFDMAGSSFIRGEYIVLPAGSHIDFQVSRAVPAVVPVGGEIEIRAAAVSGDLYHGPLFDVATARMTVVGAGNSIAANTTVDLALADGVDTAVITVTALDANFNNVPGIDIDVTATDGRVVSPMSATTDSLGQAMFLVSSAQVGTYTIEFDASNLAGASASATAEVNFVAGPAEALSVDVANSGAVANQIDQVTFTVGVEDEFENPVAGALISVIDDGGLVSLAGASQLTNAAGEAVFFATSVVADSFTVTFEEGKSGLNISAAASFVPGLAEAPLFVQQPGNGLVGQPLTPPVSVAVVDANGNIVVDDNSSIVELALRQNGTFVSFLTSGQVSGGVAVFSGLSIPDPGQGYQLRATAGASIADSEPFEVGVADFTFNNFDDLVVGQTGLASVNVDAEGRLDPTTLIRYRLRLTDGDDLPIAGQGFTFCADGPSCTVTEVIPPTDSNGFADFGPASGISADDAGITGPGGATSHFQVELIAAGEQQLTLELFDVATAPVWLGSGMVEFDASVFIP